jgi:subtilisin family serine protease
MTNDKISGEPTRVPDSKAYPPWWDDEKVRVRRAAEQVGQIVDQLGKVGPVEVVVARPKDDGGLAEEVAADRTDWGDMVYMLRKGRILVRDADLARVQEAVGGLRVLPDGINGLTVLETNEPALQVLARIDAALGTGIAFPDHVVHVTAVGSGGGACPATEPLVTAATGPHPTRPWHHDCSGAGIQVSVVDTGFDPKLAASTPWLHGVDGEPESYDPDHLGPYAGHGTFAAGVIRLMAPQSGVYVHSFLPHGGAIFESDMVAALQRALADHPDVVSMSAGTYTRGDLGMLAFRVLWENFAPKGCVLVAAAGNEGDRKPFFPAADWYAVGVGALDPDGGRAAYSNFGRWIDCYALGTEHINAFPYGTYDYEQAPMKGQSAKFDHGLATWSGTSFATPLVAGVIAARMTWSGENGQQAAQSVLALARNNAAVAIGAVVQPWMACRPEWGCGT